MKYELIKKIYNISTCENLTPDEMERLCEPFFKELLHYLITDTAATERKKVITASEHDALILKAYIDTHIDAPFDINVLSQTIYKCPSQTIRIFKKHYHTTPYAYHSEARIREAARLLETTNLSVKDVAFRLGFNDEHYFSAAFKKQTGHTPTEFRRKFL